MPGEVPGKPMMYTHRYLLPKTSDDVWDCAENINDVMKVGDIGTEHEGRYIGYPGGPCEFVKD